MRLRHQNRDPFVLKALPATAKLSEEPNTLADRFASRIEWMQKKGIGGDITGSECPPSAIKSPLPEQLSTFLVFLD